MMGSSRSAAPHLRLSPDSEEAINCVALRMTIVMRQARWLGSAEACWGENLPDSPRTRASARRPIADPRSVNAANNVDHSEPESHNRLRHRLERTRLEG